MMELEVEDVRRRLYTPPVMIRLELHHPDDDVEPAGVGLAARGDGHGDGDQLTAAGDEAAAGPPRIVDRGCLVPCFPGCHAPVYRAGHVITGHLLVRPLTRLLISGEIYRETCSGRARTLAKPCKYRAMPKQIRREHLIHRH